MTELLDPDQITALVEAAKHGQLPDQSGGGGHRRAQRLRTVDFSRPTKFTNDHQRRIARAVETFCQTAMTRLSGELRCPVELETINTTQLTWSAAQSQLAGGSVAAMLEVSPLGTHMLLAVEMPFVLTAIECLLGGSPDRPVRERRLTEIDWALTRRLLDSMTGQLSLVWQDLGGVTLECSEVDLQTETSQVAPVSEPTFVVMIESRINKHSAALTLLIPWLAVGPIAQRISSREIMHGAEAPGDGGIEQAVSDVPVTLRAEVAASEISIQDILALGPGSVIRLGIPAEHGVSLFAENVRLGRGRPGANGARRAIQLRDLEATGP
jgi:flagellar motor switch protein FliM